MKTTNIRELQIEAQTYFEEARRMKKVTTSDNSITSLSLIPLQWWLADFIGYIYVVDA
jgi:hypothetical protein